MLPHSGTDRNCWRLKNTRTKSLESVFESFLNDADSTVQEVQGESKFEKETSEGRTVRGSNARKAGMRDKAGISVQWGRREPAVTTCGKVKTYTSWERVQEVRESSKIRDLLMEGGECTLERNTDLCHSSVQTIPENSCSDIHQSNFCKR